MVFIKQITVQGFKSYKEQTVIETFSPKHNVVVGRNGSGKSNFFAAIRFVLSDAYTNMSREERQALLHEGSGTAVMSAYVEIIFDNTDNRFPTGREEVTLRRTIGLKKDEYSLDKKSASKSDVMNLLESAGFSRSNPYYIVPQGRITTLTNAKDSERLNLLKEVAGTQVYEQRRKESLKIMDETTQKRTKIDDLLKYIEERLAELEEEKEELRDFQDKDKERRCLEYTIYSREQNEINNALEEIEANRVEGLNSNDDRRDAFIDREQQITDRDAEIRVLGQKIASLKLEKSQLEQARREQYKVQTGLDMTIGTIEAEAGNTSARAQRRAREIEETKSQIERRSEMLSTLLPEYNSAVEQETKIKVELDQVQARVSQLYSKQGRSARFRNRSERNKHLDNEIIDLESSLRARQTTREEISADITDLDRDIAHNEAEVDDTRRQIDGRKDNLNELSKTIKTTAEVRDDLNDKRKELWRDEARNQAVLDQSRDELRKAERALQSTMDRSTSGGLAAVKRLAAEKGLSGYYGPLYELFEVDDRYRTSVEVTAGNSLFHVVVDNDDTATSLLDGMNREKAGRVTFVPLNRLRAQSTRYPEGNDAVPMIQKLRFDPQHQKAMEQVFGKSIICPNLEVASKYARAEGLNAITLTGDKSDRKGALTGGYHDQKRSRLQSAKTLKRWKRLYDEANDKSSAIHASLLTLEQEITQAISNLQKAEANRKTIESNREPLQRALVQKMKEVSSMQEIRARKQQILQEAEAECQLFATNIESFRVEKSSEFRKNLTAAEEGTLAEQVQSSEALARDLSSASSRRLEVEARKDAIESELRDNLKLKLDQLEAINETDDPDDPEHLQELKTRRNAALKTLGNLAARIETLDSSIEDAEADLDNTTRERQEIEKRNREDAKVIDKQQKSLEKNMQKKALLMLKKDDCSKNIRDLGVLPEEAFDRFTKTESEALVRKLHKVQMALKKYSHVNKKAFDQYNNFTKQRDQLLNRHEELEESQGSIADLIEVLDQRKDEAIERTFKQVSKAFAEVFEKLVPAGRGRLVIQRKIDQDDQADSDEEAAEEAERRRNSVENYVGVAISVSFNSKGDEQQRIQQLSGGQKSLCALALIFAIQRCDPAPFYLMDEVDAALDAQYRTAVAAMLHELSEEGQFICTTFRPEMIQTADKFYGVFFQNKISTVKAIAQEDALQFIDSEAPR
ncbi:putative Chromosome segregation protein SudA [Taphrina deformans PYCC 5710]|uniref:Structural maintenance of chromosomes protein n=1 Tax=Taphrina deformans (strain PYCC 5710 / ATCC 11124 / CBS 356.35 / IMI 108563 / JCM 9778 / NBRC 8474) TaxID=1097556 RepID=R4X9B4_TAPDE|nr:putative Chromosome segregation protein SudA [Taphrina deformans PYCC 5710]|eukprot:CCG82316.1 putative Chromosome segregation protein SudA [Taphrina deformans PYCC 5710]